jgi:hypothetical protein
LSCRRRSGVPPCRSLPARIWLSCRRLVGWLFLGLLATRSAGSIDLVAYYPGKDETCLGAEAQSLPADLKRLLIVVDVYGLDDRELSCTVVATVAGNPEDERRFRVSAHRCRELLEYTSGSAGDWGASAITSANWASKSDEATRAARPLPPLLQSRFDAGAARTSVSSMRQRSSERHQPMMYPASLARRS